MERRVLIQFRLYRARNRVTAMRRLFASLLFTAAMLGAAQAADCYPNVAGTQANCGEVQMWNNGSGQSQPTTAAAPLPVISSGRGGIGNVADRSSMSSGLHFYSGYVTTARRPGRPTARTHRRRTRAALIAPMPASIGQRLARRTVASQVFSSSGLPDHAASRRRLSD
jgi:hypothetical protein